MSHTMRTAGVLLAAAALSTSALVAPASAASTSAPLTRTDDTPSRIAAAWLAGELKDGLLVGEFGADYGLSIDAGLALSTVGDDAAVRSITTALEPRIAEYVGDGTRESYAGALAKAATFARAAKRNPTEYGGINLVTRLEARVTDAGAGTTPVPTAGRISDLSSFGDFANVVGQSYAVRALARAGSTEAGAARDFLLKQQCASGFFRLNFDKTDAASQSCVEGASGSAPDPDATSLAVINLVESGDNSQAVKDALAKAGAWLADRQRGSGAFRGASGTAVVNSNSTSLGGYALGLLKNREAAMKAAAWVRQLQPVDKFRCRTALTKDTGAVAYRGASVTAARTGGISAEARDEWRRATAQAVLGLQFAPASNDRLRIVPARLRPQAGDQVQFRTFGLAPGERACLQVKGDFTRLVGKRSGGVVARKLQMPTGNRTRVAVVKVADDVARTSVRVTG